MYGKLGEIILDKKAAPQFLAECDHNVGLLLNNYSMIQIEKTDQPICLFYLVRERGLEPPRPKALAPKASVSTNSTTRAYKHYYTKK